jgi:hypothetical protein
MLDSIQSVQHTDTAVTAVLLLGMTDVSYNT